MAVNSIVFGGIDSADYDIYISGEGVFNAPKRDVEMIEIPGRNGAFALDKGRFENIEVTYPAFNFEPGDYNTFAKNLADFRNAICSLKGYQRLTDSFHPNEYRMAVYRDGLEVKPIKYNTASEFEITFDCKPQRWLTSGETPVTIASSGDTITNPTLFESGPLLEVEGYGTISFNEYEIDIANADIGRVILADEKINSNWQHDYLRTNAQYNSGNLALMQTGDDITLPAGSILYTAIFTTLSSGFTSTSATITSSDVQCHISDEQILTQNVGWGYYVFITLDEDIIVAKGTTATYNIQINATVQYPYNGSTVTYTGTKTMSLEFRAASLASDTTSWSPTFPSYMSGTFLCYYKLNQITGYSTVSYAGHPLYIDCDLGEAYKIENNQYASLNEYIDLGSKLPTLAPGSNTITFDNTITDLKVTPRWWKV